jgi:hypothetical protein
MAARHSPTSSYMSVLALSDAPPQDGRASLSAQSGNGAIITAMRRFPPPWIVEEHAEFLAQWHFA